MSATLKSGLATTRSRHRLANYSSARKDRDHDAAHVDQDVRVEVDRLHYLVTEHPRRCRAQAGGGRARLVSIGMRPNATR